jgi:hypothetical protein
VSERVSGQISHRATEKTGNKKKRTRAALLVLFFIYVSDLFVFSVPAVSAVAKPTRSLTLAVLFARGETNSPGRMGSNPLWEA